MPLFATMMNSLVYSGSGISAVPSVPFSLSLIMPELPLGTWACIFPAFLILC